MIPREEGDAEAIKQNQYMLKGSRLPLGLPGLFGIPEGVRISWLVVVIVANATPRLVGMLCRYCAGSTVQPARASSPRNWGARVAKPVTNGCSCVPKKWFKPFGSDGSVAKVVNVGIAGAEFKY